MNKVSISELLDKLPGPKNSVWPEGERFVRALAHGSMSVELYAPLMHDPQQPHPQDELYIIAKGSAQFMLENERCEVKAGDVLFVHAGAMHRFENIGDEFSCWVIFWGPQGGER